LKPVILLPRGSNLTVCISEGILGRIWKSEIFLVQSEINNHLLTRL
jgi:hypothetical protein